MPNEEWNINSLIKQLQEAYTKEHLVESWATEASFIQATCYALEKKLRKRFTPAHPKAVLGVGGSGVVLRLKDNKFSSNDVALKFPRPVPSKASLISEMLTKEIAHLALLRHPGVVRIIFYDVAEDEINKRTVPFYIMELVDGAKSQTFVKSPKTTVEQFITLVRETVHIVNYLHNHAEGKIVHLDIKPDNIVVDASGHPIMIDLGTCKHLKEESNLTIVACTRSFAHPQLVRRLEKDPSDINRSKGELARNEINIAWDLWAFGNTLISWLGLEISDGTLTKDAIFTRLPVYVRKYFLLTVARLLSDAIPGWLLKRTGLTSDFLNHFAIKSAGQLLDIIKRLDGNTNPLSAIPEYNFHGATIQAASGQHVAVSAAFHAVLEHRLFKRLNSITQLGLVSQVYPGAKHTRREHSLGTYANAVKFIRALYDDPISPLFRQIITTEDCRATLLAALLHDLGQFPLAHDLEEVDPHLFDHSDLTRAMLHGNWNKKKKNFKQLKFASLLEVFEKWECTPERVEAILAAKPTNTDAHPKDKLLRSIISGPIDADKLDYLFRDARHLNLPYPFGTDVERLLHCLTVVVVSKVEGARDVPCIGIHAKGRVAAEFLSFSRYAMFSQAYWHHAVRAQKAMLARAVNALLEKNRAEPKLNQLISSFYQMVSDLPEVLYVSQPIDLFQEGESSGTDVHLEESGRGTDLMATDAAVLSWLSNKLKVADLAESELLEGILKRDLFKRLWVIAKEVEKARWEKIVGHWDRMTRQQRFAFAFSFEKAIAARFDKNPTGITSMKSEDAVELIHNKVSAGEPWLLVDIPNGRPGSDIGLYCVQESQGRRLRKDDRVVGDFQASGVWEHYADGLRDVAGKIRIFCFPGLEDILDFNIQQDIAINVLIEEMNKIIH